MSYNWAYGLEGFMDAYQRARQGGGRGRQDPLVEEERYNKLERERDDKSADQAYEAIKTLSSGGSDPSAIQPPPPMPSRMPGNTGFGAGRPGSLGTPGSGMAGGYRGGPLPLDQNMGPIGIPIGLMRGITGGGGKPGAGGGLPPQPQARPQAPGVAGGAPPSAGGAPPAPAPAAAPQQRPVTTPASTSPTATPSNITPVSTDHPADAYAGQGESGPPQLPPYKPLDLSGLPALQQTLRSKGYDDRSIQRASLQWAEDRQKEYHQQRTEALQEHAAALKQWELSHNLSKEQKAAARQLAQDAERHETLIQEREQRGLTIVKTKRELEEGDSPATKALQKQLTSIQNQMKDRQAEISAAAGRIDSNLKILSNADVAPDVRAVAEEQLAMARSRMKIAQGAEDKLRPQRSAAMKKLGQEDYEPVPEDAPQPAPVARAPTPQPGVIEKGTGAIGDLATGMYQGGTKALGQLGNQLYGPVGPPPDAIALLKKNPSLRQQFDEKYGQGASAGYLGQ